MKRLLITAAAFAVLAGAAFAQDQRQPPNPDANHDGKVTLPEFKAMQSNRTSRMFARMDANHDGKITQAEMAAGRERRAAQGQAAAPPAGARRGPGGGFMMMDANKDGAITKAEFDAAGARRFEMADTNHDGWLSKGELILMRQRTGGPGAPGGSDDR